MKRSALAIFAVCSCLIAGTACAATPYRVLLVDETQTLEGTLRVGGLAGAIRQSGLAELAVLFSDAETPYEDPLVDEPVPPEPYDLIILIPRGVEDGTSDTVWLLAAGSLAASPEAASSLSALGAGIGRAFGGSVRGLGPLDDLWALLTAAYYVVEGWLE